MPYSITTKDGITINNIPDDVKPDDPALKQRVTEARASRDSGSSSQTAQTTNNSNLMKGNVSTPNPPGTSSPAEAPAFLDTARGPITASQNEQIGLNSPNTLAGTMGAVDRGAIAGLASTRSGGRR